MNSIKVTNFYDSRMLKTNLYELNININYFKFEFEVDK